SPPFQLQSQTTPDLTLRIPTAADIPAVLSILQNKANSEFDKSISDATPEELRSLAQRWTTVNDPPTHRNFLIWGNEQQPLGIAGLGWIGPVDGNGAAQGQGRAGAAGVMIQPFARGKGYAYEALRLVFEYGLRELGLVEIRVGSHSGNLPMRGLMEGRFGLVAEEGSGDRFGNDLLWVVRR
ncbi:acyl-CoA N-acyltransferase, partial [Aspergillus ellipticus CBS 707.79]